MLPIFSVYAVRYPGASAALTGLAFGIYALIQSLFQIPLGWASDRWGRKPVLIIGLGLFALGSVGCALATDIYSLILARALQGTGAVGSVAFAALADLTRPSVRTQAYTITGIAIGSSFMIGLLAGPFLAAHIGLSGLFYLLAFLAFLSMILAATSFPTESMRAANVAPMALKPILLHQDLQADLYRDIRVVLRPQPVLFHLSVELDRDRRRKVAALASLFDHFSAQRIICLSLYAARGKDRTIPPADHARLAHAPPSAMALICSAPNTTSCFISAARRFFSATVSINRSCPLFLRNGCRPAGAARRAECIISRVSSAHRSEACSAAR